MEETIRHMENDTKGDWREVFFVAPGSVTDALDPGTALSAGGSDAKAK